MPSLLCWRDGVITGKPTIAFVGFTLYASNFFSRANVVRCSGYVTRSCYMTTFFYSI